jgi:superfamily II DNA helicase RecQ
LNDKFRGILRSPEFQDKLGLVAIDELHVVAEWGQSFRTDYANLNILRSILSRRIPWFGCTATLDRENQAYILHQVGFSTARTRFIRTSIDRPEITIVMQPLLSGHINDFRRLFFLVENATPQTKRDIPKTIIYIDNKPRLTAARYLVIQHLIKDLGFSASQARKLVRRYDSSIRQTDQDIIFKDFASPDGECRIMMATISLGMGMDIPDVDRVVQFAIPLDPSISDIWQRFRRAMRSKPGQGTAYFFVPY